MSSNDNGGISSEGKFHNQHKTVYDCCMSYFFSIGRHPWYVVNSCLLYKYYPTLDVTHHSRSVLPFAVKLQIIVLSPWILLCLITALLRSTAVCHIPWIEGQDVLEPVYGNSVLRSSTLYNSIMQHTWIRGAFLEIYKSRNFEAIWTLKLISKITFTEFWFVKKVKDSKPVIEIRHLISHWSRMYS